MAYLFEKGIVAHVMIQVQNKHVRWPARRSAEDDLYWRYVVSRYAAFPNVVWDVGKESYNLLKETGSHEYTIDRIRLIRETTATSSPCTIPRAIPPGVIRPPTTSATSSQTRFTSARRAPTTARPRPGSARARSRT